MDVDFVIIVGIGIAVEIVFGIAVVLVLERNILSRSVVIGVGIVAGILIVFSVAVVGILIVLCIGISLRRHGIAIEDWHWLYVNRVR